MHSSQPLSQLLASARPTFRRSNYVCMSCVRNYALQKNYLHFNVHKPSPPPPTPFVPDVATFLKLIGRGLSAHASKFKSWESLFSLSSPALKELGIEPARSRRYLLRWREKFRQSDYGIGGDFKYVSSDGVGLLQVLEVPSDPKDGGAPIGAGEASTSQTPGFNKIVLNVPDGITSYVELLESGQSSRELKKPDHIKLKDRRWIVGKHVQGIGGTRGMKAELRVQEGLWEHKRGRKVYGGERRRAETLHKLRVEERKKNE